MEAGLRPQWTAGPGLLESYHDERHAAALENLEITTATMDFLVPHDEAQRLHRRDVLERAAATRPRAPRSTRAGSRNRSGTPIPH